MTQTANPTFLRPVTAHAADVGAAVTFGPDAPLALDCGRILSPFTVAYMTYGTLNAARSNAVLVCHALTGDQFVASDHPITGKPGWWIGMVGPGKPIDTDRFFVICTNVVGGCMGSTGPAELDPETGKPFGLTFPLVTIRDMVRAQAMLIKTLGIETLLAVVGGSMGGMQALQWAASYPERVRAVVPIACAARHSAQNIAFHEVGRQAIMADPDWKGGEYQLCGTRPSKGLAVARMAAHITYLSEAALQRKFGRNLQNRAALSFQFEPDFQIESYLHHQGAAFVDRFDANSYLYITRAMDYFDLAEEHDGKLAAAFGTNAPRFCIISFSSDWLFPPAENKRVAHALNAVAANVSFVDIKTDKGHDAFLLDEPEMEGTVRGFLNSAARGRGVNAPVVNASVTPVAPLAAANGLRPDLAAIAAMIPAGARVLDVGCGDGALLEYLVRTKQVDGRGIDFLQQNVNACVARGLSVMQGDADTDLVEYPSQVFDFVILSQTIQATEKPRIVLEHLLRIGKHSAISLPNFGHWRVRLSLLLGGHMPRTQALGYHWYDTPNIHLCTIADFLSLSRQCGAVIEKAIALSAEGDAHPMRSHANFFAQGAIFQLRLAR